MVPIKKIACGRRSKYFIVSNKIKHRYTIFIYHVKKIFWVHLARNQSFVMFAPPLQNHTLEKM